MWCVGSPQYTTALLSTRYVLALLQKFLFSLAINKARKLCTLEFLLCAIFRPVPRLFLTQAHSFQSTHSSIHSHASLRYARLLRISCPRKISTSISCTHRGRLDASTKSRARTSTLCGSMRYRPCFNFCLAKIGMSSFTTATERVAVVIYFAKCIR